MKMNNEFFEASKLIADDFLQNIVFIDDKAYENIATDQGPNINHDFNALRVSKAFAKNNKICAIYRPTEIEDLDILTPIARKADIVILDWFININKPDIEEGQEEVDDDEDDPRGSFTLKLISKIINTDSTQDLKLIIIYTGDTDLQRICDNIHESLLDKNIPTNSCDNCRIIAESFIISLIHKSKDGVVNQLKHDPKLIDKVKTYEELPDTILNEFTMLTSGLLSNFALKAITEIRNNSSTLLSTFSKRIDPAYLSHKSTIPNQDDANELLVELMLESIGGVLRYKDVNKVISNDLIETWIKANIKETDKIIINKKGNNTDKKYKRDHSLLIRILNSNEPKSNRRFNTILKPSGEFNGDDIKSYQALNNISLFSDLSNDKNKEILKDFALLTHSKSSLKPSAVEPKLSLGAVVRSSEEGNNYFVCIQQRCDSARIDGSRRFLFLPLEKVDNGKFNIITPTGDKLRIINNSFSIRTIKFTGHETDHVVKAIKEENKFYFHQTHTELPEKFEWIFDLKDLFAQKIANDYASQISRVGVDEFEWIRSSDN